MNDDAPIVTVIARDLAGNLKKSWKCRKLDSEGNTLILLGEFTEDVDHGELGLVRAGTISYEYFFPERWYNIFRFEEPVGTLRNWYCNITMPPTISETAVDYVDLDIDVLVWPDQRFRILDVDEYDVNARKYGLSDDARQQVSQALSQLSIMFQNRDFPFNLEKYGT